MGPRSSTMLIQALSSLLLVLLQARSTFGESKVSVAFYGESQCPFCRKFVAVWDDVWGDAELRSYIDYTFVPWGNAYFGTDMCGHGPYNPEERACWYDHCIVATNDDEDACFGGHVVYQHSEKEGQMDIYESCVLEEIGLDAAVAFTSCCEGPNMDDESMSAAELMKQCMPEGQGSLIQTCLETRGRSIEISNAKKTPVHPGVPYVVVDGEVLDNPLAVKESICEALGQQGKTPQACVRTDGMNASTEIA